jgi:hypothetical protein
MSDQVSVDTSSSHAEKYEAPKVTRIGNARDLLAGDGGSVTDVDPAALEPQQAGTQGP